VIGRRPSVLHPVQLRVFPALTPKMSLAGQDSLSSSASVVATEAAAEQPPKVDVEGGHDDKKDERPPSLKAYFQYHLKRIPYVGALMQQVRKAGGPLRRARERRCNAATGGRARSPPPGRAGRRHAAGLPAAGALRARVSSRRGVEQLRQRRPRSTPALTTSAPVPRPRPR
jgi:hypothetical protein